MTDGNGQNVQYTTKELLGRIEDKLDRLSERLDAKADTADVEALRLQVEILRESSIKRDGPIMRDYWEYTRESRARVEALERISLEREKYIPEHEQMQKDIDQLKVWRNRFAGTLLLVGPLATITAGILLDRVIH